MQIYDLKDGEGRSFAFEVANWTLGRRGVCALVVQIPGATLLRKPRFLSWWREDEFCEFEVDGQRFTAWEPFGDNSQYWIGPEPPHWCPQIEVVREAFAAHRPSWIPFRWLFRRQR